MLCTVAAVSHIDHCLVARYAIIVSPFDGCMQLLKYFRVYCLTRCTTCQAPAAKRKVYAVALFFCLLMLIMSIIRSFVCHQRVLVGQWPDWPSSTIVLAAVSGRSAAEPHDHGCPRCFLPCGKLHPREMYASDGGLSRGSLMNTPRLLHFGTVSMGLSA